MKVLLVVDMQNDFVTGSLANKAAEKIIPNIIKKLKAFDGRAYFTKDTHYMDYLDTQEGRNLPVRHCEFGTEGHEIVPELVDFTTKRNVLEKKSFSDPKLGKFFARLDKWHKLESITICGTCTDICVISCALLLKAFLPEVKIIVDSKCCAGLTQDRHEAALEVMKSCQIEVK